MLSQAGMEPVTMAERQLGPPVEITGGKVTEIIIEGRKATLFVPNGNPPVRQQRLWCHFHSAPWFVIGEYQRARCNDPVLVFDLGQGSAVYAAPFQQGRSLQPWLEKAEEILGKPDDPASIVELGITSFSAGYGAVREIVQDPHILRLVKTVVLCDSMYASLVPGKEDRVVEASHVDAWSGLTQRAIGRSCTWICTTSQITPDSYAGTWEVALALVASTGNKMTDVEAGSIPAAKDAIQPLIRRFDKGNMHVWSYAGDTANAHMTHARRLAESIALATGTTVTNRG